MTDWLAFSRQIAADLDVVLAEHPTRLEREPVVGAGEGGDETTAIDAAAERAVVARLEELAATGVEFTLVSEELGERSFGAETPRLVLDPIDGSMNAKRGVPFFSVSLAVAEGPTMADVLFGYVFDFGTREEWTARRGEGAFLNGAPLSGPGPKEDVEILSFEATLTDSDRRADRRHGRVRSADAGDGVARPHALPHGGRAGRRRVLAEAGPKRGHRRGPAPRPRAWAGHRPAGPAALCRGAARRQPAFAGGRGRDSGALRRALPPTQRSSAEPVEQVLPNGGPFLVRHRVPGRVA